MLRWTTLSLLRRKEGLGKYFFSILSLVFDHSSYCPLVLNPLVFALLSLLVLPLLSFLHILLVFSLLSIAIGNFASLNN
jgi:hypothetical protein